LNALIHNTHGNSYRTARGLYARREFTELNKINIPMLLIHGDEDKVFPLSDSSKINEKVKGSHLVSIPRSGHFPSVEKPDLVNAALKQFFEAQ